MKLRQGLVSAGVATAAAAAASTWLARREIRRLQSTHLALPGGDDLFVPPTDVIHHRIDSHDDATLHCVERGSGRPLVLLHGVTLRHDIWSPQLHLLADRYRVIACDLRGHGQSEVGHEGYGLGMLARDLVQVLTQLDLHDALVVGHSMGGMTTLHFCVNHPDVVAERVAGIGLVATAAATPVPAPMVALLSRPGQWLVDRLEAGHKVPYYGFKDNAVSTLFARLAFGRNPPGAAVAQVREMLESIPQIHAMPSWVKLFEHDTAEALANVDVPSFVVVGSRDTLTPPVNARRIAKALPGCELHELAHAGHQLMQERPAELALLINQLAVRVDAADQPAAGVA